MDEHISLDYLGRADTALGELLNSIFDGVYIVDRRRRIVFWNRGAEEITGYAPSEVIGRRCSDNILNHIDGDGNLVCRTSCPLTRALRTGEHVRLKLYPLRKTNGRIPIVTHVAPIRDSENKIIAAIEVFRDISQEEAFRVLQEKFNALISKYVSSTTFEDVMDRAQSGQEARSSTRDLTVLFLDIVNFTGFSEAHRPEEVVQMLNDVFGMCEVITKERHGDIDKFIGDALMAVFVDANDAVFAAQRMLYDALPRLNARRAHEGKEAIAVRIGMNSGNLIQGDIGTTVRKDLTVIGDVVNTAARIQTAAPPNSIALSEATLARLRDPAPFRPAGQIPMKGKRQPIPVFTCEAPPPTLAPH